MYKFLIVVEKAGDNYSAYAPDLPGCIATGKTKEEAEENMIEAMEFHIQGLLEDGLSIPKQEAYASVFAIPEHG
nr:type II toxin-antitoxin system HicB family antitoxin [uncultured Methanospirillum sp.]